MTPIYNKVITAPEGANVFIVGDIHGCTKTLNWMLAKEELGYRPGVDMVICVGDLIDRGANNLDAIRQFAYDDTGLFHSTMGNHDLFMMDSKRWFIDWMRNGGRWVDGDELGNGELSDEQILSIGADMARALPVTITIEAFGKRYGITHAEVKANRRLLNGEVVHASDSWDDFVKGTNISTYVDTVWGRNVITWFQKQGLVAEPVEGVEYTFHGHTYCGETPLVIGNRVYLDTACVYGRALSMAKLSENGMELFTQWNIEA